LSNIIYKFILLKPFIKSNINFYIDHTRVLSDSCRIGV